MEASITILSQEVKQIKNIIDRGCIANINDREYRSGNQQWTIQRNWQHRVHKTKKKQSKNTTQYVLDTTMRKHTQITKIRHAPSYTQLEVKMDRTSFVMRKS